jgi:hypothetical protein
LTIRPRYRRYAVLAGIAWVSLSTTAAPYEEAGTVLPDTVTFLNSATAIMEVDVAGGETGKTPNSQMVVVLEFGPDGNAITGPPPDPALPDTVKLTLSSNDVPKVYMPAGGDPRQPFPDKRVELRRLQPSTAPGLYSLSIIHLKEIPPRATETWKLEITVLPAKGLRATGAVTQGTFLSSLPLGVSQGSPAISITLTEIKTALSAHSVDTSRGGFDLSKRAPLSGGSALPVAARAPHRPM